ncbi:MAG TPA: nitroreductase family protein [Armatimonadota bacterium]|nr:nitroreductase family protein [Armatimonadota bacterium]
MSFLELVTNRYSVRKYDCRPVPAEVLARILEAARLAPSACNTQPWRFFVVTNAAARAALFPHERQAWISAAPVVLVACSYPAHAWKRAYDGKNHADVDLAIAMEHLVLAATEAGLGTCWICAFDPAVFRQVLTLPPDMEPVAATPLGYSLDTPRPKHRKPLAEIVTYLP